jgi:hypothetical protein
MNAFNEILRQMDWTSVANEQDAQKAYGEFHKLVNDKFEKSFPYKRVSSEYNNRLPWLTQAIKKSIFQKHKLYSKQLRVHSQANIIKYKLYRNRLNHILRVTERTYYQGKIEEYKSNLRKSWKIINEVINRKKRNYVKNDYININGLRTSDPKLIADHFNRFFTNIGPNLDAKIKATLTNPIDYITNPQPHTMFLNPCIQEEVGKIIDGLKQCATGWDGIPASIIQESREIFSLNLTHIINLSLAQGVFPSERLTCERLIVFQLSRIPYYHCFP